jgi:hypothetical protein
LSKKKEGYKQLVRKYTLAKRKNKVLQQRPQLAVGLDEQGHDFLEPLVSLDAEDDSKKPSGPSVQRWTDQEIQAMKEGSLYLMIVNSHVPSYLHVLVFILPSICFRSILF